jgi:hypothetical protein
MFASSGVDFSSGPIEMEHGTLGHKKEELAGSVVPASSFSLV